MTNRQIVFLDFDGVLHPQLTSISELFGRLPLFEEWLVARLQVDVVISSSWRMAYDLEELRSFFSESLRSRVVDVTPAGADASGAREHQIRSWLQANAHGAAWIAFDDSAWLFAGTERLVLCSPDLGLQTQNLDEADRLLLLPAEHAVPVRAQAHPLSVVATALTLIGITNLDEPGQKER